MIPEQVPEGEIELQGRLLTASNATFVGEIGGTRVVYKPIAGERPLWDFPDGTLAAREVASYVVSEALGWQVVPPTVMRDGPHGPGMVQLWRQPVEGLEPVDVVRARHVPEGFRHVFDGLDGQDRPVSLVHEDTPELRRVALLDVVLNNADRKGSHVLAMPNGHRHGVDHGLAFHVEPKLRTVLWGWAGEPLSGEESEAVAGLCTLLVGELGEDLRELLDEDEVDATVARARLLRDRARFPEPESHGYPVIPWPPL